jgi:hypothetical protein
MSGFSIFYNRKCADDKPRKSIGFLGRHDYDGSEEELEHAVAELESEGYTVQSILPKQQKSGPARERRNRS